MSKALYTFEDFRNTWIDSLSPEEKKKITSIDSFSSLTIVNKPCLVDSCLVYVKVDTLISNLEDATYIFSLLNYRQIHLLAEFMQRIVNGFYDKFLLEDNLDSYAVFIVWEERSNRLQFSILKQSILKSQVAI